MNDALTAISTRSRRLLLVGAAMALVAMFFIVDAKPASATTVNLSGTQTAYSTVWWGTARANNNTNNNMSAQNVTWNSGSGPLYFGARSNQAQGSASFAKTPGIYQAGSPTSGSFTMVGTGNPVIPQGTFYITTSIDWCGACGSPIYWTARLNYSVLPR